MRRARLRSEGRRNFLGKCKLSRNYRCQVPLCSVHVHCTSWSAVGIHIRSTSSRVVDCAAQYCRPQKYLRIFQGFSFAWPGIIPNRRHRQSTKQASTNQFCQHRGASHPLGRSGSHIYPGVARAAPIRNFCFLVGRRKLCDKSFSFLDRNIFLDQVKSQVWNIASR